MWLNGTLQRFPWCSFVHLYTIHFDVCDFLFSMCMMHLKSYLWASFGCLVLVWLFLFSLGFFGEWGDSGTGWFLVWFLWRNLYAPAGGWGIVLPWGWSLRLKPAERGVWWSPWCMASHAMLPTAQHGLMDKASLQCLGLAPRALLPSSTGAEARPVLVPSHPAPSCLRTAL